MEIGKKTKKTLMTWRTLPKKHPLGTTQYLYIGLKKGQSPKSPKSNFTI